MSKIDAALITASKIGLLLLTLMLVACGNPRTEGLGLGEERSTSNEAQITEKMIAAIKQSSLNRYPTGAVHRFNQSKSLGCFDASFTVDDNLSEELRQGIFARAVAYPAKIRFANATKFDDREKDFRGMSISVFNVAGQSLWGNAGQQDFLLNSHPVLFARDGSDFLEFIEASRDDKLWQYFVRPSHFYSLKTALTGRDKIANPFTIRYWSTTPFRHGDNQVKAVKFSVQPCSSNALQKKTQPADSENMLTIAMAETLAISPVCFDFMIQLQTDPQAMPIEDAAVRWDEADSLFVKVATINIANQEFDSPENHQACENMSFNPWQSIAAHRPLGDINRLRKAVYSEIADFRVTENAKRIINE